MDNAFRLLYRSYCMANVEGHALPVPIADQIFFECPKEIGVGPGLRKFLHDSLDEWLDGITKDPEQSGSRMQCGFSVEYRGDTTDWMTVEEQEAMKAKETIKLRLSEILKLADTSARVALTK